MTPVTGAAMPTDPLSPAHTETAAFISQALGMPLTFEEISPELIRRTLITHGVPQDTPDWMLIRLAGYVSKARTSHTGIAPENVNRTRSQE